MPTHGTLMRIGVTALFAVLAVVACRDGTAPLDGNQVPVRDQSPLQTEALAYRLERSVAEYRVFVQAKYVNTTGAPVYYRRCMPNNSEPMFGMARAGPDSARSFFIDWGWACVGGVPTGSLASGDSVIIRVPFGSVDQPMMYPPLQPEDLVGQFRIYLDLCTGFVSDSDYCELQSAASRRSNAFLIHY